MKQKLYFGYEDPDWLQTYICDIYMLVYYNDWLVVNRWSTSDQNFPLFKHLKPQLYD